MQQLLELDARLSGRLRIAEKPGLLRSLAAFLAHSGDSWFWLAALGLTWFLGDAEWHIRTRLLVISILALALVVMVIKFTVRRRRPEGKWGAVYRKTDPHSFPSGHAARAAMLAVLACGLGPAWSAAALIVWAPLVVLARTAMGVHYLSDVLAGAFIGLLDGFQAVGIPFFLLAGHLKLWYGVLQDGKDENDIPESLDSG